MILWLDLLHGVSKAGPLLWDQAFTAPSAPWDYNDGEAWRGELAPCNGGSSSTAAAAASAHWLRCCHLHGAQPYTSTSVHMQVTLLE